MNECKKALRIYCKEFNREEIMNMSKEQKSKEELQASIAAKKVFNDFLILTFNFLQQKFKMSLESQFSEMFSTLMHLKVNLNHK